jgi:hypothetical protein
VTKKERVATERLARELARLREANRELSAAVWDLLDVVQELETCQDEGQPPAAALLAELATVGRRHRERLEGGKR